MYMCVVVYMYLQRSSGTKYVLPLSIQPILANLRISKDRAFYENERDRACLFTDVSR